LTPLRFTTDVDERGVLILGMIGDLCVGAASDLIAAITTALSGLHVTHLVLDLARVNFLDVAAVSALLHSRSVALRAGASFRVMRPQRQVREVLHLAGTCELLTAPPVRSWPPAWSCSPAKPTTTSTAATKPSPASDHYCQARRRRCADCPPGLKNAKRSSVNYERGGQRSTGSIAVCLPTKQMVTDVVDQLTRENIPVAEIGPDGPKQTDGIHVGTMHRFKGLEYQRMILGGVSDGLVPRAATAASAADPVRVQRERARDRSLLFVAATRARDNLAIFWHGTRSPFITDHMVR
jgi:anti-anti-sigma factor